MYRPVHVDGRSLVILRRGCSVFRVLESGILSYDGRMLSLGGGDLRRVLSDGELQSIMPVAPGNRIPECRGFDFFLLSENEG
jgi:hypothetical protein